MLILIELHSRFTHHLCLFVCFSPEALIAFTTTRAYTVIIIIHGLGQSQYAGIFWDLVAKEPPVVGW